MTDGDSDNHHHNKTTANKLDKMGDGGWYYVPKVWTPYGGWWANPKHWKRNTSVAGVALLFTATMLFRVSAENERRPMAPYQRIPSQSWCKHAKIDDPSLK